MKTSTRSRPSARERAFRDHLETIKPENRERGGIDLEHSVLARREQLTAVREARTGAAKAERERRRKARQQLIEDQRDKGTPELRQKLKARVRTQSLLDRYHARRSITRLQLMAGRKFYGVWVAAQGSAAPIGSYAEKVDRSGGGGGLPRAVPADGRCRAAVDALGPGLAPIAIHVVIADQSAEEWALAHGKPKNDGMPLLRAALDLLVAHYGRRDERQVQSHKDIELSPG